MIRRLGFVWKMLPPWLRLKLIRVTQIKFTASAAAVITNDQGKVLLLDHVLRPFSGWGIPGGFMSVGEQPEETIRRELREETGIELDALTMVRIKTLGRHLEIIFCAKALGEPEVMSHEILALGWFDVDAMPTKMSNAQKKLIRGIISSI
ncbi:MAG: NUDIX domain-containing protein [Acidobacteriota bacterium]